MLGYLCVRVASLELLIFDRMRPTGQTIYFYARSLALLAAHSQEQKQVFIL